MIESIADKNTAKVFASEPCKKLPSDIQDSAREVLAIIDAITKTEDLWAIPALNAKRLVVRGRPLLWSVRINKQWRIIFDWDQEAQAAHNVEITDYH